MNNYDYENRQVQEMSDATKHVLTGNRGWRSDRSYSDDAACPRSGEDLRAEIKDKAIDLRDRTTEGVKDRVSQVVSRAEHLKGGLRGRSQDIKHRGQDVLVEQLDRVAEAVEAAKKAIEDL